MMCCCNYCKHTKYLSEKNVLKYSNNLFWKMCVCVCVGGGGVKGNNKLVGENMSKHGFLAVSVPR